MGRKSTAVEQRPRPLRGEVDAPPVAEERVVLHVEILLPRTGGVYVCPQFYAKGERGRPSDEVPGVLETKGKGDDQGSGVAFGLREIAELAQTAVGVVAAGSCSIDLGLVLIFRPFSHIFCTLFSCSPPHWPS